MLTGSQRMVLVVAVHYGLSRLLLIGEVSCFCLIIFSFFLVKLHMVYNRYDKSSFLGRSTT